VTSILIDKDAMLPMRDGVRLATDVYRLQDAPRAPVLLTRTPYDKEQTIVGGAGVAFDVMRAVQSGYVVVIQDVRGRFGSEGEFTPHFQEPRDGADTIAWAAAQPWSSGVVGGFGGSYLGGTQWLEARERPDALRAMASAVAPSDMYEGMAYQGGAHVFHGRRWAAVMITEEIRRRVARGAPEPESGDSLDVDAVLSDLPLAGHSLLNEYTPWYRDWLAHPTEGPFWAPISASAAYEHVGVPSLHVSGWYDIFLSAAFENFRGMRQNGASERARQNQRVIIGPWSHSNFTGSFPEREFGSAASSAALDLTGIHLRWFDRWLKDAENGADLEPPVLLFVMGIDRWRAESDWPLPNTVYRSYYLHSPGGANSLRGDGTLSGEAPVDEVADTFLFNPLRPVPTVGGQVILPGANAAGPRDQRPVEARDDVLVYSSAVLDRAVGVIGPIELRLFVASSARDTDFTGKLVDVHPDGRAIILTEGILRARYRNSRTHPELLEPESPMSSDLTCGPQQTFFCRGTASVWKYRAATSHGLVATAIRAVRSPAKPRISTAPRSIAFSMTRRTLLI
jgi:putative CocE/NonD family hydrolase